MGWGLPPLAVIPGVSFLLPKIDTGFRGEEGAEGAAAEGCVG